MTIGCNIWMICLILIWFFYDPSRMFQLPQFVWTLCSSVWDVLKNFLPIDATDRSKIRRDQKRLFIAVSLYPLSFFAITPFPPFKGKICWSWTDKNYTSWVIWGPTKNCTWSVQMFWYNYIWFKKPGKYP